MSGWHRGHLTEAKYVSKNQSADPNKLNTHLTSNIKKGQTNSVSVSHNCKEQKNIVAWESDHESHICPFWWVCSDVMQKKRTVCVSEIGQLVFTMSTKEDTYWHARCLEGIRWRQRVNKEVNKMLLWMAVWSTWSLSSHIVQQLSLTPPTPQPCESRFKLALILDLCTLTSLLLNHKRAVAIIGQNNVM